MKFNYTRSNTTLSGHDAIFGLLRANKDNGKHIFIVPDRYTLSIEKDVCEKVFEDGSFFVDVYTFTRLAQKALGKFNKKCLSKEGTVLLMNRVLRENNDKLDYYKDVKSLAFSREMFASIASLRSSNVSYSDIEEKLKEIEEKRKKLKDVEEEIESSCSTTEAKLKDIALIYREYEKALKEKYHDTVTRVDWLIDNASNVDFIKESDIYILGFNVFSNQQLKVIKALLKVAKSVSVAFCIDKGGFNKELFLDWQLEDLIKFCEENGIESKEEPSMAVLKAPFDKLHREMFGSSKADKGYVEKTKNVRIYGADNKYNEIKAVAKEIVYLIFNENYRYKDFAVVCDDEGMIEIIQEIFDRCEIPHFVDRKYYVKDGFFAKYVNSAFTVIDENFSRKSVFSFMRNPYHGLSRKEIQIFENYCDKYNCNYGAFLQKFTLNGNGVDEYNRVIAEAVREKIVSSVSTLKVKDKVESYCDYIINKSNDPNILKISEKYLQKEDIELKVYSKIQPISEVAEEIKSLSGGDNLSISEFLSTFNSVIENMTESVLPQYVDSVFVGSQSDSRFSQIKAMFIVGANDGNFPKTIGDKLVLGYYDEEIMKKNGINIFPTPEENIQFEKFNAIDLVTKADRLYITYSTSGDLGGESTGVREIRYRLNIEEKPFYQYHNLDEDSLFTYNLVNLKNCYYEYVSGDVPSQYREAVEKYLIGKGILNAQNEEEQNIELLRGYQKNDKGEYKLSVSKMESYFACPYRNYLRNVLKLEEKEQGALRVNDKGTIIHDVLEGYFKDNTNLLRTGSEEAINKLIEDTIKKTLDKGEYSRFFEGEEGKLERDNLAKESRGILKELTISLRNSSFNPEFIEKYFGNESEITIKVDDKVFSFSGFVDRVDVDDKNNIIVIDYKTGKVTEQLSHVYTGQKIQLYLYLKYFLDKGYNPAGVFYIPIAEGYKREGNNYAMLGQIKDGYDTFFRIDNRIKVAPNGKYKSPNVGINVEKVEETVKYNSQNRNILSDLDFRKIADYVIKLCKQAILDIIDGDIEKNPQKDKCKYCAYRNLCGSVKERMTVDVKASNFYLGTENDGN